MTTTYHAVKRTISTVYDTGHDTSEGRAMLEINTSHWPSGKAYTHGVARIEKTQHGTRQVFGFRSEKPVPSKSRPTARYSEKGLRAAHDAYLAEHNLNDPAVIAELIEWAKGAGA